jgi:hypothetical protein
MVTKRINIIDYPIIAREGSCHPTDLILAMSAFILLSLAATERVTCSVSNDAPTEKNSSSEDTRKDVCPFFAVFRRHHIGAHSVAKTIFSLHV